MNTSKNILFGISELDKIEGEELSQDIFIDIKEKKENIDNYFDSEIALLLRLKEKSLVLFEGLKNTKDVDKKLEMVINYLEYQLYVIEDRLKILQEVNKE